MSFNDFAQVKNNPERQSGKVHNNKKGGFLSGFLKSKAKTNSSGEIESCIHDLKFSIKLWIIDILYNKCNVYESVWLFKVWLLNKKTRLTIIREKIILVPYCKMLLCSSTFESNMAWFHIKFPKSISWHIWIYLKVVYCSIVL